LVADVPLRKIVKPWTKAITATVFASALFGFVGSAAAQDDKRLNDIEAIGNRNVNKGSINLVSLNEEIDLGRRMAAEYERQVDLLDDPVITEYVNRVGQNLVRNSDAMAPFTIKVVDSEEVNAAALPGGFLYVNTSLLLAASDESEFAAVLAHEIAHVAARHGTESASKARLFNVLSIPLIFLGGPAGIAIRQAGAFLVPAQFFRFSRKAETEADFLGIEYMFKAGYDPLGSIRFFEKLQAIETIHRGGISELFASHPPTAERIKKAREVVSTILPERSRYVTTTSQFIEAKERLIRLHHQTLSDDGSKPVLKRRTHRRRN
jgi:predicted Zn-dependent protease